MKLVNKIEKIKKKDKGHGQLAEETYLRRLERRQIRKSLRGLISDDLKAKLPLADDAARREALREWAARHTNATMGRWRMIDRFLVSGQAA